MEEHHIPQAVQIRNAHVHNLKNIDVDIPLHQIVGIAGVSGPANPRWHWACCMRRAPGATWMPCPPTPAAG